MSIRSASTRTLEISWPLTAGEFVIERTPALMPPSAWESVPQLPALSGDRISIAVTVESGPQFYRLRQVSSRFLTLAASSPTEGERGVSVTRETIFRLSDALASDTVLTTNHVYAVAGGRRLLSRIELSGDRRTVTLFPLERMPADARVEVVFDGVGVFDAVNRPVDLDADGIFGGAARLRFQTLSTVGLSTTGIEGRVLASEKNPDGSDRPLSNVTISVDGMEESLRTTTDAQGYFRLMPSPAGRFFVSVDGRTAEGSQWPGGAYYPFVDKAWEAMAGRTNNLAGGSGLVHLPLIQADALRAVSSAVETRITFSASVLAAQPALAGVEILVPPNALFSDSGARGGQVGIAPVAPDRLPEPLPAGLNLPLVITIQTDGPSNFDVPVPVKFPNLPDPVTGARLGAGEKTVLWSFNHDTGRWEPQGTMTISADGLFAVSDPGVGVRQPGWHGAAPGSGGGGPGGGPPSPGCPPYCGPQPDPPCSEPDPCGHLHYLYREAFDEWQRAAELRESYTDAGVVALGLKVDNAYDAYVDCREANGRPCEGGAGPAPASRSAAGSTDARTLAPAALPDAAKARIGLAIQSAIDEQNAARSGSPLPGAGTWFALRSLDTGFVQRGRLNDSASVGDLILASDQQYEVRYYDAAQRRGGSAYFRSKSAGDRTYIPYALLYGAEFGAPADADADGLSDFSERVLGTRVDAADTDGDGVPDGAEIAAGTSPTDGEPLGLGVVASRDTPGAAVELDTANDVAVVADSSFGLAVFDVSNPLEPVLMSQLDPAGATFDAVAMAGEFVAAVPGASPAGITIFGLSQDGILSTVRAIPLGDVPEAVAAAGRFAYAPGRTNNLRTLAVIQLRQGVLRRHVNVPGGAEVTALAIDGDVLWALSGTRLLSFRMLGDDLLPLGTLEVGSLSAAPLEPGPELTAGNGRVYVGEFTGFRIIDATDPSAPALLHDPSDTQAAIHDFALSGSGLLLPVTSFAGTRTLSVSAYDVRTDRATNFLTSFDTPGNARAAVLHRGYVLTADDSAGLATVNFLAPDRGTNAPQVALRPFLSHAPGGQEADELFQVSTLTRDDVQVRDVEFHIDGSVAGVSGKFPFATTLRAPARSATKTTFVLRAKATDTGGNESWTEGLTIALLPDSTPPSVISISPAHGSTAARGSVSRVAVLFDSQVDAASLGSAWTLVGAGSDGNLGTADDAPVTGGRISMDEAARTGVMQFDAPLLSGRYRSRLAGTVADLQGNPLGSEVTWEFQVPTAQILSTSPAHQDVALRDSLRRVEVRFDERLMPASVTPDELGVMTTNRLDPVRVAGGSVLVSPDARAAVLEFGQPVPEGVYRIVVGSGIRDVYGSPVATNLSIVFTVKGPALWTNDVSGLWTARTNWSGGSVPILNDHVIIDRPTANPTISLRSAVTLTALRCEEAFAMDTFNANLRVLDHALFRGPFSIIPGGLVGQARSMEFHGEASLAGRLVIEDEARFMAPVAMTTGDFSFSGGTSRFFDRLEMRRTLRLEGHVLRLEPGAVGTLGDSQIGFGGADARFIISDGARLELAPTNTQFNAVSFVGNQGETGAMVENQGEFVKRGAASSYFVRMELFNAGNLRVEEGLLSAGSDFTNTGSIVVSPNSRLDVGSRFRQGVTGRIANAGTIKIPDNSVLEGSYESTGVTEVSGAQTSAQFIGPLRSTGSWLITGSATFHGATVELLGPVTLRNGRLILHSPAETLVPDLRLEKELTAGGGNVIGGSGLLVFREPRTWNVPVQLQDTVRLRFEAPAILATNLTTTFGARIDLLADATWVGGSVSGNFVTASNVVLELATAQNATLRLPFPQAGILRKTGAGTLSLYRFVESSASGIATVTNRSLIDVQSGILAIPTGGTFFVQEAGRLHLAPGTRFVTEYLRLLGGEVTGSGTLAITSDAINRGCRLAATLSPGDAPGEYGTLGFVSEGSPTWLPGSRTILDIGGTEPGVTHDQIVAERTLELEGGTLELRTAAGFSPALGQEFTLMTGRARTGTFSETNGVPLANGLRYRVVYDAQSVKVRVE